MGVARALVPALCMLGEGLWARGVGPVQGPGPLSCSPAATVGPCGFGTDVLFLGISRQRALLVSEAGVVTACTAVRRRTHETCVLSLTHSNHSSCQCPSVVSLA